jgi:hypothetical protein
MEASSGVRVRLREGAAPIARPAAGLVRKVSDEQPLDTRPVGTQPTDEQPVYEQSVNSPLVDEQPVDEQPVDEQPVDEQPVDEAAANESAIDPQTVEFRSQEEPRLDPFGDRQSTNSLSDDELSDDGEAEPIRNPASQPTSTVNVPSRRSLSEDPSSPAVSSRGTSSRVTSSRAVSSRAVSSRAVSSRATARQEQDSDGTFAAAERGRGVVVERFANPIHEIDGSEQPTTIDEGRDEGRDENATELAGIPAESLGATEANEGPVVEGPVMEGPLDASTDAGEGESSPLATSDEEEQAIRDERFAGSEATDTGVDSPVADGEVLEQGVPFAESDAEASEAYVASDNIEAQTAPAPVLIAEQAGSKPLSNRSASPPTAPAKQTTVHRTIAQQTAAKRVPLGQPLTPSGSTAAAAGASLTATTTSPARNVVAVSAAGGLARRVQPIGMPPTIPHRSLPALPPRKVEPQTVVGTVSTAPGMVGGTAGGPTGEVATVSTAGNMALAAAQPGTGIPGMGVPGMVAGGAGETPLRNAAFCRRLYNERNCCSDENACNDHRAHVKSHPLSKISLDITPTCNLTSRQEGNQANCGFPFEQSPSRVWRDRKGVEVARGRVTGFAHLRVEVTDDKGVPIRIRLRDLNEDDICFLAAWCGVPSECRLDDVALAARNWTPITMTWKASALCHKPLYFQEEQLERYGHTTGPIFQPVVSGAHFFANIALLPYNMGIHPMSECQYALGYYRPGSCAPWMIPPFPLSARGALAETGVILGGFYLIP